MRQSVYLAGCISADPATYEWRREATKYLGDKFEIIDPTRNDFNLKLLEQYKNQHAGFKFAAVSHSQLILPDKDYQLVRRSSIILVNLRIITPEKPPVGTLCEMAWGWQWHKPVVAVVGDNWYCKHPFIQRFISFQCIAVERACQTIIEFFYYRNDDEK